MPESSIVSTATYQGDPDRHYPLGKSKRPVDYVRNKSARTGDKIL